MGTNRNLHIQQYLENMPNKLALLAGARATPKLAFGWLGLVCHPMAMWILWFLNVALVPF
jgi:hypothetical protein